jgi:hypothetical protein
MAVRLSALRACRHLPPGRFLVLISVRGCVDPMVIVRLEGLDQLKTSNDLIGARTRDLPACSIVPQTTTLPRAPYSDDDRTINHFEAVGGIPTTEAVRSKASIVFARWNTGIVGSNPTQGMDDCLHLFCVCAVLCAGSGLTPVQGALKAVLQLRN